MLLMQDLTISIFGNKIFLEIINELNLFPESKVNIIDNFDYYINNKEDNTQIIFYFINDSNKKDFLQIKEKKKPIIVIAQRFTLQNQYLSDFTEQINMPFKIGNFRNKVISLLSKCEFRKSYLIVLLDYVIDKNERKIKKNGIELKLTEKETDFLILFSRKKKPLSKLFFLKNVWNYSLESDTHTVETHIHRLRKKILKKFNDNNFIKNNIEGYYI